MTISTASAPRFAVEIGQQGNPVGGLLPHLFATYDSAEAEATHRRRGTTWASVVQLGEPVRAAVYINITGGVLQGATANVPLDVYAIDYDDDADEADDDCVVEMDGDDVVLMQVGAEVDAAAVAALVAEPTRADRNAQVQTPTPESISNGSVAIEG